MLLRMEHLSGVENARHYSPETIKELEQILLAGGYASPDPRRKHFYDLLAQDRTFYIFISPATGRVELLAAWLRPGFADGVGKREEEALGCSA
jgi:hypothetical protein